MATKGKESMSIARARDLYMATHPTRFMILDELKKDEPLYVAQLTKRLKKNGLSVDRKIVSYHLTRLLEYGFVEGKLALKSPKKGNPVAVKYFSRTKKAKKIQSQLGLQ